MDFIPRSPSSVQQLWDKVSVARGRRSPGIQRHGWVCPCGTPAAGTRPHPAGEDGQGSHSQNRGERAAREGPVGDAQGGEGSRERAELREVSGKRTGGCWRGGRSAWTGLAVPKSRERAWIFD